MNELNDAWSEMLKRAIDSARAGGRHDVADYLELKATNDAARQTATTWLIDSMIEIAAARENDPFGLAIDRNDPYHFSHLGANLTGSRLSIRHGVRCLSIEAGWTRTPADGFMRGGAMAVAKITHFGLQKENEVFYLVPTDGLPIWKNAEAGGDASPLSILDLRRHFGILLGPNP